MGSWKVIVEPNPVPNHLPDFSANGIDIGNT